MFHSKKNGDQERDSQANPAPETEVLPHKPQRRRFTASYKLRILEEADACQDSGQIGALLRREGIYSSHLANWRKLRRDGALSALTEQKRGPKPLPSDILKELEQLKLQNQQLQHRLAKAETIIEVQKKLSTLLGLTDTSNDLREN